MNKLLKRLLLVGAFVLSIGMANETVMAKTINVNSKTFPDTNLRKAVLRSAMYDENSTDVEIDSSRVTYVTVDKVNNLKGLELLDYLQELKIYSTNLKTINIPNQKLTYVYVYAKKMTKLNIANMSNIKNLNLTSDKLTSLDIRKAKKVEYLAIVMDNLKTLKMDTNKKVTGFKFASKKYTCDLSKLPNVEEACIYNCPAKKLDCSKNPKLWDLCLFNMKKLEEIKLPSKNKLGTLTIFNAPGLSKLDISKAKKLSSIYCEKTGISKVAFPKNSALGYVNIKESKLSAVDFSNLKKLVSLNLRGNKSLKKVNVSKNKTLANLDISNTSVEKIDVSKNKELATIHVNFSKVSSLNLKNNKKIYEVGYNGSKIKKLDLSKYAHLTLFFEQIKKGSSIALESIIGEGYELDPYSDNSCTYKKGKLTTPKKTSRSTEWVYMYKGDKSVTVVIEYKTKK